MPELPEVTPLRSVAQSFEGQAVIERDIYA